MLLLVAACLFFLWGSGGGNRRASGWLATAAILLAALFLLRNELQFVLANRGISGGLGTSALGGERLVVYDQMSFVFQWFFLLLGAVLTASVPREQVESDDAPEFFGLVLTLIAGLLLVASANELILLFLSLELISIPTYVLLYMGRRDAASQEAATKYFLLSVLSAAVLLYGFSFLYGLTGTTNLTVMRSVLHDSYSPAAFDLPPPHGGLRGSRLGLLAVVLIFAGLGFKLAAVPFHFYAPDVYQGTTAWNAGLLSVAPKAAGLVALVRIASQTMVGYEDSAQTVALILALFTMTVGNVLALMQNNIRRLLAYSGIAHAGYMLVGLSAGFWDAGHPIDRLDPDFGLPGGLQAALFYLMAYCLVTAGLFALLVYLAKPGRQVEHVEDLLGLARSHPAVAIAAAVFLFSLAGIPPLPGFWAKLGVFSAALSVRQEIPPYLPREAWVYLAVIGVVNAAIGAVYYLRIVAVMFFYDPLVPQQPSGGRSALNAGLWAAVLTVVVGLQTGAVLDMLRGIDQPQAGRQQASAPREGGDALSKE